MHHWHNAVDEGQSVRAVLVDFTKAFDHIDHKILMVKVMDRVRSVGRHHSADVVVFTSSASACQDRFHDVGLGGDGCWPATRVLPWAIDVTTLDDYT